MQKWSFLAAAFLFQFVSVGQVWAWEGIVVKVLDGDSLRVQRDGRILELRLYGIDTPEYRQGYGNKAKQFTKGLLDGQRVTVTEKDVDRYGRIVALVSCQDKLANRELIRAGLAWYYPRYCRTQPLCSELAALEREARSAGRGLWGEPDPVAPWEWKRRARTSGSASSSTWRRRLLNRW